MKCNFRLFRYRVSDWMTGHVRFKRRQVYGLIGVLTMSIGLLLGTTPPGARAQDADPADRVPAEETVTEADITTPDWLNTADKPVVEASTEGQYVLEFNRSPVVGNRLRLTGIYDEARLRFTRPRNWALETVQVLLRYRHSGALYATRSNLTVMINGTSVGSVPLNQPQGDLGEVVFDVPTNLLQNYNEVTIAALQNNSPTCTQDALDPSLWTEIMPDSKLVFDFQPQPISLDFSNYPYPIFDELKLERNQVAYLRPEDFDQSWLTHATRFQASLGRIADYRDLDTRMVDDLDDVTDDERLIIIGTPETQPILSTLDLPLSLENGRFSEVNGQPVAEDTGLLMLTTVQDNTVPVLVITGNSAAGVTQAVQFLIQPGDREIGTGHAILVNDVTPVESPEPRIWPGYLPTVDNFQLSDLRTFDNQPYEDVTVRGSHSPALEFDFHALPDDRFLPGNFMTLRYSYGPQVNTLTSLVEIQLDGVAVGGKRLSSIDGGDRQTLRVELPAERIKPYSRLQVNFRLDPRERRSCSRPTDQQLWGTIHADTSFELNREQVATLPDLELLRTGYPLNDPQDLSTTVVVIPDQPSDTEVMTLMAFGERLGRLSKADTIKLEVYLASEFPEDLQTTHHLVGIGTQNQFPFIEAFETAGFRLQNLFTREWRQSRIQTLPDTEGLIKQVVSPWNSERVLLALSGQTDQGLEQVRDLVRINALFSQLEGDTVLVSADENATAPYEPYPYTLEILYEAPRHQEVTSNDLSIQVSRFLRSNWLVLGGGILAAALMLYGVVQLYLKRVIPKSRQNS